MTLGAKNAASAVPPVAAAAALVIETRATMAVQAARRGEFEAARYLLEQALTAIPHSGLVAIAVAPDIRTVWVAAATVRS